MPIVLTPQGTLYKVYSHSPGGVVFKGGALVFLMRICSNQTGQNRYDFLLFGRDQAMHIANRVAPRTPNESIFGKPHVHWLFRHVAHPADGFVGGTGATLLAMCNA